MKKLYSALLITTLTLLCAACSGTGFPGVFKIDIAQGNVVTQQMLDQLQPGMSRHQVVYIMGSPMLEDTFNANRWDYYLNYRKGKQAAQSRHITLFFKDNQYTHYTGEIGELMAFEQQLSLPSTKAANSERKRIIKKQ